MVCYRGNAGAALARAAIQAYRRAEQQRALKETSAHPHGSVCLHRLCATTSSKKAVSVANSNTAFYAKAFAVSVVLVLLIVPFVLSPHRFTHITAWRFIGLLASLAFLLLISIIVIAVHRQRVQTVVKSSQRLASLQRLNASLCFDCITTDYVFSYHCSSKKSSTPSIPGRL